MTNRRHDQTHAHALDGSPFDEVRDPTKRAFLVAFCELGTKRAAARAIGISPWTCYNPGWRADERFQIGLALAEEVVADKAEAEAWRRGVEGLRRYKHSPKTDRPLEHPDVCDVCGRSRKEHVRAPDGTFGPHPDVDCPGFTPAPYYEEEFSDALIARLLQAYRPEKFADKLRIQGVLANIRMEALPDVVIARVAAGEDLQAVLVGVLEAGGPDAEAVRGALPEGSEVGRRHRAGREPGELVQDEGGEPPQTTSDDLPPELPEPDADDDNIPDDLPEPDRREEPFDEEPFGEL